MWKKVIPVAAVLILAWIGLNLITAKDEEESVANAPDAATSEVAQSPEVEAETVNLAENEPSDVTPESAPADEESAEDAEPATTDDGPAADTVADAAPADATTETDTTEEKVVDTDEATESIEVADADEATESTEVADAEGGAESTETAASSDEEAAAETTETVADAPEASADDSGSTTAMRYPTDPVTGASIFDQGMVEVVIQPAVAPVEAESEVAAEESADTAEPADEEVAATEPEETVEPVTITRTAMRYPTDSVTGATIFDQGMVEVEFESVVEPGEEGTDAAQEQAADTTAASDTKESAEGQVSETGKAAAGSEDKSNVQMRYPTDPVTGATIYDQGMVEVAVESDAEATEEVAENAEGQASETAEGGSGTDGKSNVQMRYPTDPVTGATIYDQGMVEVAVESDAEATEEVAEKAEGQSSETAEGGDGTDGKSNVQMRYPTDPVTGATIYDQGMVEVATETAGDEESAEGTESSSEGATESAASETTVETASDTAVEKSAEVRNEAETATTTGAAAAIAERGTFSLGSISRTLGGVFGTATTVLSSARDEASAQALLPRLEKASASLNAVSDQFATLPEYAKGPLAKVIKRGMSRLKPLADTALTREGVGPVLLPVMGPMLESMQSMLR